MTCHHCKGWGAVLITYGLGGSRGALTTCDHCEHGRIESSRYLEFLDVLEER